MTDHNEKKALFAEWYRGEKIEREATNPDGATVLRQYITHMEAIRDSWNEAYDGLVALIQEMEETAAEWNGEPTYGPGPFNSTVTRFTRHVTFGDFTQPGEMKMATWGLGDNSGKNEETP